MKVLDHDGTDHLIDKIYDLINSGGSADYIVEEGTSGIWTYRKWASGIAECWGDDTQSVVAYANVLTGAKNFRKTVNLPSNLFTQIDDVNFNCVVAGTTTFPVNIGGSSTTSLDIIATALTTATTAQTFRSRMLVKGLWKEFTPSTSRQNPLTEVLYSGSWTATQTSANGAVLTQTLTVPNGYYIVIVKAPNMSSDGYSLQAIVNGSTANNSITRIMNHGTAVFTVKLTNSSNTIYATSAQSASMSFSYLERGGIFAMRVANA